MSKISELAGNILATVKFETVSSGDATNADVARWHWTGRAVTVHDGTKERTWVELDSSDSFAYSAWYSWALVERGSKFDISESIEDVL